MRAVEFETIWFLTMSTIILSLPPYSAIKVWMSRNMVALILELLPKICWLIINLVYHCYSLTVYSVVYFSTVFARPPSCVLLDFMEVLPEK
jgi:hypothetical protein